MNTTQLMLILHSLQDGEITCSRARECIEAVQHGSFTPDWLPKSEAYFGDDESPIEIVKAMRSKWNLVQVCSYIGSKLMTEPAMFERHAVVVYVRKLRMDPKLQKYFPS